MPGASVAHGFFYDRRRTKVAILAAIAAALLSAPQASGQSASPPAQSTSVYDDRTYPDVLDGTLSAGGDLEEDETPKRGFFRFPTALDPWFTFKERIRNDLGISIGGSYGVLGQGYSDSLLDQDEAVGSKFTLNLSADIINRGQADALSFDMAIEDRRPLGTDLAPLFAGFASGSAAATAATWGDFSLGITQAYIRQNLFDNRLQYAIGKLFAPNYVNAYPLFDDNRQFLNQNFTTSPTIAVPLRGFGMVGALYPTNGNLYVKAGVFTPYSDDTGWTVDDFFERNEYFYNIEVGLSSLARSGVPIQARGPMDSDNIHLSFWYRDPLDDGSPEAYGVAFNANYTVKENLLLFLRGGWSEGNPISRNIAVGFGYRPVSAPSDLFGAAFGWMSPDEDFLPIDLRDQYTGEIFYRFQVTPHFALTPDVQLILDPTLNPFEDSIWNWGLRARVTF